MEESNGFDFIESLWKIKNETVLYWQKVIQNDTRSILHWFKSQDDSKKTQFIQKTVQCYLHLLPTAKLAQGLFKLLIGLPQEFQDEVRLRLLSSFEHLIHDFHSESSAKTLCEFLNQNQNAREMCKRHTLPISKFISGRLEPFAGLSSGTLSHQHLDAAYYTIKICIHCLQICNDSLRQSLFSSADDFSTELKSLWEKNIAALLSVLFQSSRQDLLGLVGTALAMILNLSPGLLEFSSACKEIINMIIAGQETFTLAGLLFMKPTLTPSSEDKNLKALMIIKGVLLTSSKEHLCHDGKEPLLLYTFPVILKACRGSQEHHYIAFQILALWFQKLKAIGVQQFMLQADSDMWHNKNERVVGHEVRPIEITCDTVPTLDQICGCKTLMSSTCPIMTSTLSTIWLNWESPVDGVSEYVVTVFDCLLNIWSQAVEDHLSGYTLLGTHLMDHVLMMSWHTKMRYRPLCLLLPFIDVFQLLSDHTDLKEDLLKCMSINTLATVASDVYNAFLTQMTTQAEEKKIEILKAWCNTWMPTLLKGMTSSIHIQRLKICTYWIPHSLKQIRSSQVALLETLEHRIQRDQGSDRIKHLLAWTTVGRYARDLLGISLEELQYELVRQAVVCLDEEVRTEALFLLCNTLRKASPVSDTEIQLLKAYISVNLKTDSTSFRQNMVSAMKKLIMRIRDSCLTEVRSKNLSDGFLSNGIDFIEWLYSRLLQSLFPGGAYQCRQTGLDLLECTLNLLVYQKYHHCRKGKAHEGSNILIEYANSVGKWNFFTPASFTTLLSCFEDGAEDLQTQCLKLLVDYFPWPNSLQWIDMQQDNSEGNSDCSLLMMLTNPKTVCNLMNRALHLASSPKSFENHSGLLLLSLVMKVYVLNVGVIFQCDGDGLVGVMKVYLPENVTETSLDPPSAFLDVLLQLLDDSVSAAKKDPAIQFKAHPIHGLTQYVTECLKETLNHADMVAFENAMWSRRLERLKDLNIDIISLMLQVLSGGSSLDQCPSFAEMGIALENLISSQDENEKQDDLDTNLSPDFQLLLSWCWINLKESCTSLGQITASSFMKAESKYLLSPTTVSDIGEIFVRVLTTCRHRGAIEGCRNGFSQFCEVLLSSKNESFSMVPKAILDSVLLSLSENSLTASVSRRSAGLPIIVETVTYQAMKSCHDKHFLTTTVDKLYLVASEALPSDPSQHKDLSQVHAMNILKVFCHAKLASHLGPLLSKLTILVIESFDSPSWAMRNAATQLISTLVMRIFGQRNKNSGSMTLEELDNLHPELVTYILHKLRSFSCSRNLINPSLYVLLTLLSNVVMSPSHLHRLECRKTLQSSLSYYLENPVHSLRNLSAQAYVALFELDNVDETVKSLISKLTDKKHNLNVLHGHLLCVYHLISSDALSKDIQRESLDCLCEISGDLFNLSSSCFLPQTQVVLIIQRLLLGSRAEIGRETGTVLWSHLESLILRLCQTNDIVQVGAAHCMIESFKVMTLLASRCQDLHNAMTRFVISSVTSSSRDLRESVISTLSLEPTEDFMKSSLIQEAFWLNLTTETCVSNFVQSCDILYSLHDKYASLSGFTQGVTAVFNAQELTKKWNHIDSIKACILLLQGILHHGLQPADLLSRHEAIRLWCDQILQFGAPFMNENLRLSAARALRKGGKCILVLCAQTPSHEAYGDVAASVIKAAVQFLEDYETNVRDEASIFVSSLMDLPTIHANLALNVLSQYVGHHLWFCDNIHKYLIEELFTVGNLTAACENASISECQQLFAPELDSVLLEIHAKMFWAYHTLKSIIVRSPHKTLVKFHAESDKAATELQRNISRMSLNLKENPFFNISNSPKVASSLLGIILFDTLCQEISNTETDLHKLVTQLSQMSHIHPLLKDVSSGIQYSHCSQSLLLSGHLTSKTN